MEKSTTFKNLERCLSEMLVEFSTKLIDHDEFLAEWSEKIFNAVVLEDEKSTSKLAAREEKFHNECLSYAREFGLPMVEEFFSYWSEPNKSRTKMRFEQQPTWEIHRRLITWARRNPSRVVTYNEQNNERKNISVDEAFRRAYGK